MTPGGGADSKTRINEPIITHDRDIFSEKRRNAGIERHFVVSDTIDAYAVPPLRHLRPKIKKAYPTLLGNNIR